MIFFILMCLALFIPAVAMAKWRENYSADEIQMTHQRLHLCFNVTFFALAALATKFFKLVLHFHRCYFPPQPDTFYVIVLVFFPLFFSPFFPHKTLNSFGSSKNSD